MGESGKKNLYIYIDKLSTGKTTYESKLCAGG